MELIILLNINANQYIYVWLNNWMYYFWFLLRLLRQKRLSFSGQYTTIICRDINCICIKLLLNACHKIFIRIYNRFNINNRSINDNRNLSQIHKRESVCSILGVFRIRKNILIIFMLHIFR